MFIFKNVIILYSFLSLANFKPVRGKNCTVLYKLQIALFWSYISFTIEKKSDNLIFQDPEWSDIIEAGNNADKHQQEQYIIGVFKKNCFEKFAKLHEKHPWWRPFSGTLPDYWTLAWVFNLKYCEIFFKKVIHCSNLLTNQRMGSE